MQVMRRWAHTQPGCSLQAGGVKAAGVTWVWVAFSVFQSVKLDINKHFIISSRLQRNVK